MYVIADIEWVEAPSGIRSLTQISAARVDGEWNVTDIFDSFVQPMDRSLWKREHVAYNGGSEEDFISAPSCSSVISEFCSWLGDDTLLWWFSPARDTFDTLARSFVGRAEPSPSLLLGKAVTEFLYGGARLIGSYRLAKKYDIELPFPEHLARNDVALLLALVRKIEFAQKELLLSDEDREKRKLKFPYHYDETNGVMHAKGCKMIPAGVDIKGFATLGVCLKKGYAYCSCLRSEIVRARRSRVDDIISRSDYNFAYAVGGSVFHHYTCRLLRNAKNVLGCVNYKKIADMGMRPCSMCRPSEHSALREARYPATSSFNAPYTRTSKKPKPLPRPKKRKMDAAANRPLTDAERVALTRLRQAQRERLSGAPKDVLLDRQRDDFYTLTQPRFAFFAATGYKTFHLRSCNKLTGIIGVRGFDTYEAARTAGFKPCKNCKPSPKQNIEVSIPIDNVVRENESITELSLLCVRMGYEYRVEGVKLYVDTPVGRWILNTAERPVTIDHINLVKEPNGTGYHRQPRIFLSLRDALRYINRHDATLQGVSWDADACN